ncbi:MAG: OsmC family protein [bacterium]
MPVRRASAVWTGKLKDGSGTMALGSGAYEGKYSFGSRFEENPGTNPEELIGAAHAGCFSMAFAAALGEAGFNPKRVSTNARVHLGKDDVGFKITKIELTTEAEVPEISEADFQKFAKAAKEGCPISRSLAVPEIVLTAKLIS